MTATSWVDPEGRTWTVGAHVLWRYGRRDFAEFGAYGVVEAVPEPGAASGLILRLQPAPETQRERRAIEKRRQAGEDVTRVVDFFNHNHVESGLMLARDAYLANADRFRRIGAEWQADAEKYDEHGLPLQTAAAS